MTADVANRHQVRFGPVTQARLDLFGSLLLKWTAAINLVSKASATELWTRHILDSLQIFPFRGSHGARWLDMGSGGGLPGMAIAIVAAELDPSLQMILVESDQRKAEFLRHVSRETGVDVAVEAQRLEQLAPQGADIVSARALAPLPDLCAHAHHHLNAKGRGIFLKGAGASQEIEAARRDWRFDLQRHPSQTDPAASVIILSGLHPAHG